MRRPAPLVTLVIVVGSACGTAEPTANVSPASTVESTTAPTPGSLPTPAVPRERLTCPDEMAEGQDDDGEGAIGAVSIEAAIDEWMTVGDGTFRDDLDELRLATDAERCIGSLTGEPDH